MAYTSRIANQLLVTPYDDNSAVPEEVSERLTEEEFCEKCYSHPKFEWDMQQYLSEEKQFEYIDVQMNYDEIRNQIHQQKTAYDNFNLWLNNFDNNKVYTINGNAGTGKTTFINHKKYTETKLKWVILDIHLARSLDEWISDIRTEVSHFEQAQAKVYGSIMNKIWEMLFQGLDENNEYSIEVIYDNLLRLTDVYKEKYASKYPSGRKLLDEVCEVMAASGDVFAKVEAVAELFKEHINGKIEKDGIISILNIFLLILRCLADSPEDKYVILFDNFERFIAKDELYNKDVDEIRLLLSSYIKRINQKGNMHNGHFKFVMAVRDSTARMCGVKLQASDVEASNLDLSEWYDTQNIIERKKKWYAEKGLPLETSDIVEQITGDLRIIYSDHTVTGLKLIIDPLFNGNKRLIIDFIGSMVELPSNEKYVQAYCNLWKEDTDRSRFAARSIIRGMLLNELERKPDKLFEHLKTYSTRNKDNGIGDARKILTILYNNIQKGNENEMTLVSVFEELFRTRNVEKVWNNEIHDSKRKTISTILFYMNSYNRRENDWIQFVDLQFRESGRGRSIIVEDAAKLEQILNSDMRNFTIHLMPAGRVYLIHIVASFEFFSLRYVSNYTPLFALVPTPEEVERCISVKELPCYKKIECVARYAVQCIEVLQDREDTIKLLIGNSDNGKYHAVRIINQHKSYIESFATYIREKYCNMNTISDEVRKKYEILFREIMSQRNRYNKYENDSHKNWRR